MILSLQARCRPAANDVSRSESFLPDLAPVTWLTGYLKAYLRNKGVSDGSVSRAF